MVKIFIGNLSQDTTADELRVLFSQYGKIADCTIVKNFGFVHMDDKAEAEEAIRKLHHYELNGQPMNVELSRGKSRGSTKIHVGNIDCSNQELRSRFEEFGAVVECDIVKNYAFVHMERMEDALEAINALDNTAFKGKLMSVKLSTSRLRTAPGMGDRAGCYRCGQEGHWSKECPLDQNGFHRNGSEPRSDEYEAERYGGRGGSRGYMDFGADPDYGGAYAPVHGYPRGSGPSLSMAGYRRAAADYESAVRYGPPPPGYLSAVAAEHSMARMYGSEAAYRSSSSLYGAVPAYPVRRSPYDERDPYGVVDYYEKYRANAYGSSYFEERRAVPLPAPSTSSSTGLMRERVPPSSADLYEHPPLPPPPAPASYYARDRSPIRRVPAEAGGYAYERTHLPPAPAPPRSSSYDHPRDPGAERARYPY